MSGEQKNRVSFSSEVHDGNDACIASPRPGTPLSYRYVALPGDPFSDDNVLHLTWQPLAGVPEPGTMAVFATGLVLLISAKWRLDSTWAASPSTCDSS